MTNAISQRNRAQRSIAIAVECRRRSDLGPQGPIWCFRPPIILRRPRDQRVEHERAFARRAEMAGRHRSRKPCPESAAMRASSSGRPASAA